MVNHYFLMLLYVVTMFQTRKIKYRKCKIAKSLMMATVYHMFETSSTFLLTFILMRRIFGPNGEEVVGRRKTLRNEELHTWTLHHILLV
jgi:hypothetical protein